MFRSSQCHKLQWGANSVSCEHGALAILLMRTAQQMPWALVCTYSLHTEKLVHMSSSAQFPQDSQKPQNTMNQALRAVVKQQDLTAWSKAMVHKLTKVTESFWSGLCFPRWSDLRSQKISSFSKILWKLYKILCDARWCCPGDLEKEGTMDIPQHSCEFTLVRQCPFCACTWSTSTWYRNIACTCGPSQCRKKMHHLDHWGTLLIHISRAA